MLDQHGPTPPPQEGGGEDAAAAGAGAAPYDPNQPPGPPPSGLHPYHGHPYIHDPSGYLTANLALAEQYSTTASKKKSRSKKKKAAKASNSAKDCKKGLGGGGYAAPVNPRKQKPCKVEGCPRQSRGVKFDFMCQRHHNEARGIKSNCVDWRMLLQKDESKPGRDTKEEKKAEAAKAKAEEKQRADREAQLRRDAAVADAVAQAVLEEEKEKDEGDAIEALTKLSKGNKVEAV